MIKKPTGVLMIFRGKMVEAASSDTMIEIGTFLYE